MLYCTMQLDRRLGAYTRRRSCCPLGISVILMNRLVTKSLVHDAGPQIGLPIHAISNC